VSQPDLRLYYREGCHLCEELAALLYRGWPQLVARYGMRIPVLEAGGQEVCALQPDVERLQLVFGAPRNPV